MSGAARGEALGVGIIGCGVVSEAYLSLAPLFAGIEVRAVADIDPAAAGARGEAHGVPALGVDEMLARDDIDIGVNLTVPAAHAAVSRRVLEAGKHVYSEKPFVLSAAEGRELAALARARVLRVGSAPDTFLGGTPQLARELVDGGRIGRVTSATAHVMSHGMEHWHPNPDFFYKGGAGPVLDVGPYYLTALVQLLGPVERVAAMSATPRAERLIACGPRAGETVAVEAPTTLHAVLEFVDGAVVTLGASWDVRDHAHPPLQLYGERGTLSLPDPNFFGGELLVSEGEDEAARESLEAGDHPFAVPNRESSRGPVANYRMAGLAEMANAIREGRPHRCSLELALHVVETMTAVLDSAERRGFVEIESRCERPAPLDADAARALLA